MIAPTLQGLTVKWWSRHTIGRCHLAEVPGSRDWSTSKYVDKKSQAKTAYCQGSREEYATPGPFVDDQPIVVDAQYQLGEHGSSE